MNKITGLRYDDSKKCFMLQVQPGVLLSEVNKALDSLDFDTSKWSEDSINALELLKKSGKWFFTQIQQRPPQLIKSLNKIKSAKIDNIAKIVPSTTAT